MPVDQGPWVSTASGVSRGTLDPEFEIWSAELGKGGLGWTLPQEHLVLEPSSPPHLPRSPSPGCAAPGPVTLKGGGPSFCLG